jgi:hypothetical protein
MKNSEIQIMSTQQNSPNPGYTPRYTLSIHLGEDRFKALKFFVPAKMRYIRWCTAEELRGLAKELSSLAEERTAAANSLIALYIRFEGTSVAKAQFRNAAKRMEYVSSRRADAKYLCRLADEMDAVGVDKSHSPNG